MYLLSFGQFVGSGVRWALVSLVMVGFGLLGLVAQAQQGSDIPMTGTAAPSMESYDRIIPNLMRKYHIPGGAVAVVKDGRLVLARGYGLADKRRKQPVQPDSLFRIASISKSITAVAILKLVEEGSLDLDAKAFQILKHLRPPARRTVDSRIPQITIRQLLQHSGGWDPKRSFDPMFIPIKAARTVGAPAPGSCETVIRYMLGQPLDFTPGSQFAYSNFGYCVLGRVIEKVTGRSYEQYVQTQVLAPMGISCMRIGRALLEGRAEGEVRYYDYRGARRVRSVFHAGRRFVSWPYGGFHLEAMDAHGGWIASAIDLMRFVTAVDGRSKPPDVLRPETICLMVSRPALPDWKDSSYYYGMGWNVRPVRGDANWWHTGGLPGTRTIIVRTHHGLAWAALFNSRPKDVKAFTRELDKALWQAAREVTEWPRHDLFQQYPSSLD